MIPAFLRSLATLLRQLIADGRAVHATEADAVEFDMLADLFERHGAVRYEMPLRCDDGVLTIPANSLQVGQRVTIGGTLTDDSEIANAKLGREVTSADVALGFLLSSKARIVERDSGYGSGPFIGADEDEVKRAAVCAELAVLAKGQIDARITEEYRAQIREALEKFGTGEPNPMPYCALERLDPHRGTIEGALAVWSFVVDRLAVGDVSAMSNEELASRATMMVKYRHELEAMNQGSP